MSPSAEKVMSGGSDDGGGRRRCSFDMSLVDVPIHERQQRNVDVDKAEAESTWTTVCEVEPEDLDLFVIDDEEEADEISEMAVGDRRRPPLPRSIDEFFQAAYSSSTWRGRMKYWLMFITLGVGNMGDATELSSIGYLMANEEFQDSILNDNFAVDGSIVASVSIAGMIIGGLVAGAFEDTLGRKRTLLGGLSINGIFCILTAFAPNVGVFSALRFFVGFGIGAILSSLTALSAELSPPRERGLFVTVVSGFWSFGMLYCAVVANSVMGSMGLSWRAFLATTAVPTVVSVFTVWWLVPDSARFLALHGKYDEAVRRANQVAERLGYQGEKLRIEEVRHYFADATGGGGTNSTPKVDAKGHVTADETRNALGKKGPFREAISNLSALYSLSLRNRTISLQLLWIFLEMGSGLGPFINVIFEEIGASAYIGSTIAAIGNLVGSFLGALFLDSFGRKSSISSSMVVSAVTMLASAWAIHHGEEDHAILLLAVSTFMFSGLVSLAWNATMTLTSEMFPTKVRSTGLGYIAATGRTACILQQFISGALVDSPGSLLAVASLLLLVGASTMLLLRTHDMARQPLDDAVSGSETNRRDNRGDFMMVPVGKDHNEGEELETEDSPAIV